MNQVNLLCLAVMISLAASAYGQDLGFDPFGFQNAFNTIQQQTEVIRQQQEVIHRLQQNEINRLKRQNQQLKAGRKAGKSQTGPGKTKRKQA